MPCDLDLVLYGASGFVGRLIASCLSTRLRDTGLRWGLAGRKPDALRRVRESLGAGDAAPLLHADAEDPDSLDRLARSASVVISTVGPYHHYGTALVAACAAAGTGYVDLCGEPLWMHDMIAAHDTAARASGARLLFSCGYDSVPFDLGVHCLQQEAIRRFGAPLSSMHGRVRATKGGGFSGGTIASLEGSREMAGRDPVLAARLADPFSLCPGFDGPPQPDGEAIAFDETARSWAAPFVMAPINTKNVHRTNLLLGHPYGTDFTYDEMTLAGGGESGRRRAEAIAERFAHLPTHIKPGEGSSEEARKGGFYDLLFHGRASDGRALSGSVRGEGDPGYGSTSRMIAEIAEALAETTDVMTPGISTPTAAFGAGLMDRFAERGIMRFELE